MGEKRKQSREQIRNLYQYKEMSDEDFDALWEKKSSNESMSKDFEDRIAKKLEEFSQDYDVDDLKINDKETLRAFIQAIIALEDYERLVFDIRTEGDISQANINIVDRLSGIMSDLRKDISRFQQDLNITRKIRKSDRESSVVSYIADIKDKARQYYESKLSYIFCPECNILLGNIWVLYPDMPNKITLKCDRVLDDGGKCGHVVTVTTKELTERHGTNKPEIVPEALL